MTPVLNNGFFLRDTNYQASSHIDSYHMINMLKDSKPDNMGVIDLWAMLKKVDLPLYSLAKLNSKNVEAVKDANGRWTWQIPVENDQPFIIEDMDSSDTTKGIDGKEFQIKLSRREFGKGEIITNDKYSGVELFIVPDKDIIIQGDHAIYTVQLVNNDNARYLDNDALASGTKYFRVGSAKSGDYGQEYADMITGAGFREYFNILPNSNAHVQFSVSTRAKLMLDGGLNADGTIPVTEIWRSTDKNLDPSVRSLSGIAEVMGKDYITKARNNGTLTGTYLTKLDAKHMTKVAKDIELYAMWGKGGRVRSDGPDDIRLSTGLWKQLDSSFKRVYNKGSFSLKMFRNELYNFYNGRVNSDEQDPKRVIEVETGIGGIQMINTLIAQEAAGLGWIVNADKSGVGAITGTGMNLGFGYFFSEIVIPFFARLKFKITPAFDPIEANSLENPMIDGFPLSSYSFLIHDINDSADNIFLKKWAYDPGFRWWYENGTMDYFGRASGFQSSGRFTGFRVFMEQMHVGLWVKDPTKMLKIVMKNPTTGGSL
jgi:hypothetical protein